MDKFKKLGKVAIPLALAVLPILAFAALPTPVAGTGTGLTLDKIQAIIERVASFLVIIGVILAVLFIVWGGIKYMTARGDPAKSKEAKESIIHGVIGAAVVLGVGVILSTTAALVTRTFFGAGQ